MILKQVLILFFPIFMLVQPQISYSQDTTKTELVEQPETKKKKKQQKNDWLTQYSLPLFVIVAVVFVFLQRKHLFGKEK